MSARASLATAARVLRQLRRDPRTLALLLVVPALLLVLVRFLLNDGGPVFDRYAVPLVGIFPQETKFLDTPIAMLRERTTGTLERLLTLPIAKGDLLAGYGLAFGTVAAAQGLLLAGVAAGPLGVELAHGVVPVVAAGVANALLGMALGLFLSAFASTEFQAVQFMPAVLLPQLLLCGLVVDRDRMGVALEWLSAVLPMTYAYEALDAAAGLSAGSLALPLTVVLAAVVAALAAGAVTLRRRTA